MSARHAAKREKQQQGTIKILMYYKFGRRWSELSSSKGKWQQKRVQVGFLCSCGHLQQREGCGEVRSERFVGDVRGVYSHFVCCLFALLSRKQI